MSIIEVNGLTKKFDKTLAVDNLSFQIKEHMIVGFVGKNGAGKTTTIRCMLDFLKPSAGTISIAGKGQHEGKSRNQKDPRLYAKRNQL